MKKMIKVLSLAIILLAGGYFVLESRHLVTAFSQQANDSNRVLTEQDRQNDLRYADTIARLTNRTSSDLVPEISPNGEINVDLQGRFQSVMLAQIDKEGDAVDGCVTSLGEANAFFGRNLKTGEAVKQMVFPKDKPADPAAQYGMSEGEYQFYMNLIANAAKLREANANAGSTITIQNNDGAGEGFNDATALAPEGGNPGTTVGQQRLNLFNFAASIWGAYLDSKVPVTVRAQFDPLICTATSATLGSAGPTGISANFTPATPGYTPLAGYWYPSALGNKIRGSDSSANPEINATFNSSINNNPSCLGARRFYYGFDNTSPAGTTNLLVVLLHEMGHGLGFVSFVNNSGGNTGQLFQSQPDIFTRFMFDRTVNKYWYQMTDAERVTSATNAGNVLWDGPNVKIASGFLTAGRETATGRVQLYTPAAFSDGSSIAHFDTANFPNLLMEPNITANLPLTLDLTRQQMRDIGWYRDSTNDLVPDTITNVQVSGTSLAPGAQATVTWTNGGGFNNNVTIELSSDGGVTFPTTLATNVANNGSFTFTVPNSPTTQARIRVREENFVEPLGVSATNFTIGSGPPQPIVSDVSVTNVVTPNPVIAGANLTYTITIKNTGPDDANTIILADTLPEATSFVSFTAPADYNCSAPAVGATGNFSCIAFNLEINTPRVITLVVKVSANTAAGTNISNTVSVSSNTMDPNTGNNTAAAAATVAACSYSLSSANFNAAAAGGSSVVNVIAGAGCAWTAQSNDSWITITGGASGSGNGTVTFSVAANAGPGRIGTITIAGQIFTVTQANGCSYVLSPASQSISAAGGNGSFSVSSSAPACAWTAQSNVTWITTTSSGSGNGTVSLTVAANPNPTSRTGTIIAGGQTFTVTQDALVCSFSINPASANIAAVGGNGSFNVVTAAGCSWTAVINTSGGFSVVSVQEKDVFSLNNNFTESGDTNWITITSGASGTGSGIVAYTAAANTVTSQRSATITVSGQVHTITQAAGTAAAHNRKTAGVFRPSNGITYMRNSNTGGFADINMIYGVAGDTSFAGDWNGDHIDTIGIYRNGVFYLRNSNTTGAADVVFAFGAPGDQPVAGDWNGDGIDTIGVYRPSTGVFMLRNSNSAGPPDVTFVLGNPGDVAIAGDWNGDGITTTGVFRPTNGIVYLKNTNVSGDADIYLVYGVAGDKPLAGDWDGDGIDSIGIYRDGVFYLRNSNTQGVADLVFALGNPGDEPIAGDWDGLP